MGFEAGGLRGSPNWANGQSSLILESASSRKVLTSGFGYHWGSVECDRGKSSRACPPSGTALEDEASGNEGNQAGGPVPEGSPLSLFDR